MSEKGKQTGEPGSVTGAGQSRFWMWAAIALGVLVLVLGFVAVVLGSALATMTTKGGETPAMISGTRRRVHDSKWLDIPTLEVKDIPLSFPLVASGAQRKSLTCGVVIRFAPPEGEEADVKELQKTFIPRVTSLRSEFRKIVIEQMNAKGYSKLSNQEVKNQLLKTFRQAFQEKLKEHALDKHARVHQVMWGDCAF